MLSLQECKASLRSCLYNVNIKRIASKEVIPVKVKTNLFCLKNNSMVKKLASCSEFTYFFISPWFSK